MSGVDPSGAELVTVECYAGHRGEQEPRRIHVPGGVLEVVEILDRWQGPDHRYFKVRSEDGGAHLLRHDEIAMIWERLPRRSGS